MVAAHEVLTARRFTVPQYVQAIDRMLRDRVDRAGEFWLMGDVVDARPSGTRGHRYWSLRDPNTDVRVRCVQWAGAIGEDDGDWMRDGTAVEALGHPEVMRRDGQILFVVSTVRRIGEGTTARARDELIGRLTREGVIGRAKRPLPRLPAWIGVVTSDSGAAVHDVRTVAHRRYPGMLVRLFPAAVQGDRAVPALLAALDAAYAATPPVLLIGRGGGNPTDLAAFDDEAVLRKVAASPCPTISMVGHAIDHAVLDLVADAAAPTPSAAAELATPDWLAMDDALRRQRNRLRLAVMASQRRRVDRIASLRGRVPTRAQMLDRRIQRIRLSKARLQRFADRAIGEMARRLDRHRMRLDRVVASGLEARSAHLRSWRERVQALDPLRVLERGYAMVTDDHGRRVTAASADGGLLIRWLDGCRRAVVVPKEEDGHAGSGGCA
ncbi:Exodeoxyribonuclease 7 large subunit [Candidatus Hydrogenisulfobacillus filiaventi]|uniref:Exodeoxyribonuclease 7 large subunit n=1 Tax=Candidatus Hydrogenisulfobacillus filiaventi TaxID=2707344 RepID=A0A6F8ZJ65_9FIRM|nr:Exodeoxyribonuclease 7 large subunit [Candidatus Hydrogenisulfobacillus filiaventi]